MKLKRTWSVGLISLAVIVAGTGLPVAYAAPPTPILVEVRGDSLPAGTGSQDVPPGVLPNGTIVGNLLDDPALVEPGTEGRCYRTTVSYPAVIDQHPEIQANNKACPGLMVEDFNTGKAGEPPQYEGLSAATAVVMLSEGANTIGFPDIPPCMAAQECVDGHIIVEHAKDMLKILPSMLLDTLVKTREHAPNAWIVPVAYPSEFGTPGPLGLGCLEQISDYSNPLRRGERQVADELQQGLNAAWATAIEQFKSGYDDKIVLLEMTNSFNHPPGYENIDMRFDACSTQIGDLVNGFDSDVTRGKPFHLNRLGSWVVADLALSLFKRLGLISG